ncbi:hypothetical protein Bpfe_007308 [Biomphalaria pfeifferi]|uniref:Uncharacterized protein n=1 Tax=Biomphalaria pfeifferi TaxID=112525 RepID=A0AAD8BZT4_BIOPF|nr:hypothetical protein Bpfe_007308 [Biomphalaria pfeifferi]
MQPRLVRNGTLTSTVDQSPPVHSQVRTEWPNVSDPTGGISNGEEFSDQLGVPNESGSSTHRGSLRSLRPTKFSPPPKPPTFISNNVLLTILFIFVVILVLALIVTFTVFE